MFIPSTFKRPVSSWKALNLRKTLLFFQAEGGIRVVAVTGVQTCALPICGRTATQRFALKLDPRARVTPVALRAQFAFLQRLRDTVNAVTTAVITIRNVRAQLDDRLRAAPASDTARLGALAGGLSDRLSAIEGELYQVRNRSFQDPLNFPPKLVERISGLGFIAGGSDAAPTAPTAAAVRLFAPEIERQLLALKEVLTRDLPAGDAGVLGGGAAGDRPQGA